MRENLRDFVYNKADASEVERLSLIRHLAGSIFITSGWDFNELRELVQERPDLASDYVSSAEEPVPDPLRCITIRPFRAEGYTTTAYEPVALLAGHLRDLLVGAESTPDFDGIIRSAYIEPEHEEDWNRAAASWRQTQAAPSGSPTEKPKDPERRLAVLRVLGGSVEYYRGEWKIKGISKLVESEKAAGAARSTEKTVRADLKKAAQEERDEKRAGFSDGLGQR